MNINQAFLFTFLCIFSWSIQAQNRVIEVTSKRNDDQTVDFSYRKSVVGSYVLSISFDQLSNCNFNGYEGTVKGSSGRLFTLKPNQTSQGISYSFSYQYLRGEKNTKVDPTFVYLLPFSEGKEILVRELSNLGNKYLGKDLPENWKAYAFYAEPEDTVYAIRKGIVVEVIDEHDSDVKKDYSFKRNVNQIIVEHKDGTLGRYSGFKKGEIFVREGDKVLPRTPLGKLDQYDNEGKGELRIMVYYFDKSKFSGQNLSNKDNNYYSYVFPQFYTSSGNLALIDGKTYLVSIKDEIIGMEMSKKERKKYLGTK